MTREGNAALLLFPFGNYFSCCTGHLFGDVFGRLVDLGYVVRLSVLHSFVHAFCWVDLCISGWGRSVFV